MKYALYFLLIPSLVFGAPKGASVSHGKARITHQGQETRIETSHRAVIDWDSFSVAPGETTRFIQPHSHSAVINRVGTGASKIDGNLFANGRVYLLNPNGVLVGKNGVVSCAAFAATTLDFDSEKCFKGGKLLFKGNSTEKIVNYGKIEALNGDVLLFARVVFNEGTIAAKEGITALAAASEIFFKPDEAQHLYIAPEIDEKALLGNSGVIEAAQAELKTNGNVYRMAINHGGVIEANTLRQVGGQLILTASEKESDKLLAQIGADPILGSIIETRAFDETSFASSARKTFDANQEEASLRKQTPFSIETFSAPKPQPTVLSIETVSARKPCPSLEIPLPGTLYTKANQIFAEMFQKLQTYDELLFACNCFLFGYDKACYDQLFHPKGMVSSFDLFSNERKCMLRQKYRNYELKYVESF